MRPCRIAMAALAVAVSAACAARTARAPGVPAPVTQTPSGPTADASPYSITRASVPAAEVWDATLAAALASLAISPTPHQHLVVAAEYRRLSIFDDALAHMTAASQSSETRGPALDGLARLWRDAGHPAIAIGHAHRAVALTPTAAAYNTLGTVLVALGWLDAGRDAFSRAVSIDPAAAYAWSNLCYSWYLDVEFDKAIEACSKALELDTKLDAARTNLALVYAGSGRLDRAARELERTGDVALSRYNMGLVYLAFRQFDRAANEFEAAYRMKPSFDLAGIRARQARALAGAR